LISSVTKTQKWLGKGGLALALFVLTMTIGNLFAARDKQVTIKSAGHDFLAFYTAGTFVREGRREDLYKVDEVRAFEQKIAKQEGLELGVGYGPYWNPPVFAWLFVPLAGMAYGHAWWLWFSVNLVCAAAAMVVLTKILKEKIGFTPLPQWKVWGLVPLLIATSLPFIMALGHGQNTCISLLLLSGIVWFWRKGDGLKAGLICGLLCYKPQLAAVIAGMLVLTLGWRAMLGLGITGAVILGLSAVTMPGAMHDWTQRLPGLVKYMQVEHRYMWERHVTLKAFWRLLLQGYEVGNSRPLAVGLWVLSVAAISFGMTFAVVRTMLEKSSRDRLIAATIVAMPLLMPFYFDYDLLLMSVAAVVVAADRMESSRTSNLDRSILAGWVVLFLWMFANPFVAGRTHVNGTVLVLSALATMLIAKACEMRVYEIQSVERQPLRASARARAAAW
jgi:hypothetical protein